TSSTSSWTRISASRVRRTAKSHSARSRASSTSATAHATDPPVQSSRGKDKTKMTPPAVADGPQSVRQGALSGTSTSTTATIQASSARATDFFNTLLESVSLADARAETRRLRAKLKHPSEPSDPLAERRAERDRARLSQAKRITFRDAAEQFIAAKGAEWRNAKHRGQWEATLKAYAYPVMGDLPVGDIDEGLVLRVLEPILSTKTETASRLRGRIESILDWTT